jgi:hypothetical protein
MSAKLRKSIFRGEFMKSMIITVSFLVMTNAFAIVEKAESLRLDVQNATKETKSLVSNCANIDSTLKNTDQFLVNLNREISTLKNNDNRFLNEARGEIKNARSILYMAKEDCDSHALSRGKILLEMYLVHIDTDLMIYSNINED